MAVCDEYYIRLLYCGTNKQNYEITQMEFLFPKFIIKKMHDMYVYLFHTLKMLYKTIPFHFQDQVRVVTQQKSELLLGLKTLKRPLAC